MIILADSDILIEILRARDLQLVSLWSSISQRGDTILYTPVSAAEISAGARLAEHWQILTLLGPLVCVPIGYSTGKIAGDFLLQYAKSHGLRIADALIAAAAIENRAALWTRNLKHYPMKNLTFY